jgi:hypothetical protein
MTIPSRPHRSVDTVQMLAQLIAGRLTFVPDFEPHSYTFEATATSGNLLKGLVLPIEDEELPLVWRARRESNPRPTGSKPVALSS